MMVHDNITKQRGQSMLEYLITLAAIVFAIIAGTIGINSRLRNSLSDSLNATHENLTNDLATMPTGETKDLTGLYGTPDNYTGNQTSGYYFHEGESNMSYVPEPGTLTHPNETRNAWTQEQATTYE